MSTFIKDGSGSSEKPANEYQGTINKMKLQTEESELAPQVGFAFEKVVLTAISLFNVDHHFESRMEAKKYYPFDDIILKWNSSSLNKKCIMQAKHKGKKGIFLILDEKCIEMLEDRLSGLNANDFTNDDNNVNKKKLTPEIVLKQLVSSSSKQCEKSHPCLIHLLFQLLEKVEKNFECFKEDYVVPVIVTNAEIKAQPKTGRPQSGQLQICPPQRESSLLQELQNEELDLNEENNFFFIYGSKKETEVQNDHANEKRIFNCKVFKISKDGIERVSETWQKLITRRDEILNASNNHMLETKAMIQYKEEMKKNQRMIKRNQEAMKRNQQAMSQNQQAMERNEQEMSPTQQEMANNQQAMAKKQQLIAQHQQATAQNQQALAHNQHAISRNQQAMEQNKVAMANNQQAMEQNQQAVQQIYQAEAQSQTAMEQSERAMEQTEQAMKQDYQTTAQNQQELEEIKQEMAKNQQEMAKNQQEMAKNQQAMTKNQQAMKLNQQAATPKPQATEQNRRAIKRNQPPDEQGVPEIKKSKENQEQITSKNAHKQGMTQQRKVPNQQGTASNQHGTAPNRSQPDIGGFLEKILFVSYPVTFQDNENSSFPDLPEQLIVDDDGDQEKADQKSKDFYSFIGFLTVDILSGQQKKVNRDDRKKYLSSFKDF